MITLADKNRVPHRCDDRLEWPSITRWRTRYGLAVNGHSFGKRK